AAPATARSAPSLRRGPGRGGAGLRHRMSATGSYFYDVVCPLAYLRSTRIRAVCEAARARPRRRPRLLRGGYPALRPEGLTRWPPRGGRGPTPPPAPGGPAPAAPRAPPPPVPRAARSRPCACSPPPPWLVTRRASRRSPTPSTAPTGPTAKPSPTAPC